MWIAFLIFLGGGLGSVARWVAAGLVAHRLGGAFPWGTLVVNVTGSFVIGFFAAWTGPGGRWAVSPAFSQFFMLGICGGYTTFSSFSLQTLSLMQAGEWWRAGGNCILSVVLCLAGVWLGHTAALALAGGRGT